MFEKLFKRATKKAEKVIDRTAEEIGEVVADARQLIEESRDKIRFVAGLMVIGIVLGITADIISIVVGLRAAGMLKK